LPLSALLVAAGAAVAVTVNGASLFLLEMPATTTMPAPRTVAGSDAS